MVIMAQNINQKQGYKLTEVGVIPEDWIVTTLGEIVSKERPICYGIVQTGKIVSNGVPCIRVIDLDNGKIKKKNLITTSKGISDSYKRTILKEEDLVIALRGKIGELAIVDKELIGANLTRGLALIAVNASLDPSFFLQQLSSSNSKVIFEKNLNGSALQEIPINVLRKIPVAYPRTKFEQRAIATALSDVDALITALDKLIAKKRDIKQATMQQLLTGKTRLPGFRGEWKVKKLEEIREKFVNGGTPSTQKSEYWQGNIPWITGADVINQKISDIRRFITIEAVKNSSTNIVERGNLLLVTRTGVGKLAVASFDVAISQDITGIYVKKEQALIEYLFHYFNYSSETLKSLNQGTSIAGITRETLLSTKVYLPPLPEQTAIANVLSDMDAEIAALEQKRDKTRALKQGMMQELLTGKTRLI